MPIRSVVIALYDYEASTEQELSIKKNDILYILEDADPNWWKAELKTPDPNGLRVGLVPSNYVEPVSNCSSFICAFSIASGTVLFHHNRGVFQRHVPSIAYTMHMTMSPPSAAGNSSCEGLAELSTF
jgi:hypothetical protein